MTTQNPDTIEPETCVLATATPPSGTIVVAESMRGVVALFIGDDRANLLRDLKGAFPEAEFVLDPTALAQTIAKAAALVDAPHLGTDLAGRSARLARGGGGLEGAAGDSRGRDAHLRLDRSEPTDNGDGAGRRCCLRSEPHCGGRALPPRREIRWFNLRLSLGRTA
jgi:hypothetical protein